jgi:AraC-like DNA-binding protein
VTPPTYWRCEPDWAWQARPLPDYLLWFVLDGIGQLDVGGQQYELAPGTCALFRPGDEPAARHDPRRRLLVFGMHFQIVTADGAQPTPEDMASPSRWGKIRDPGLVAALARRCDTSHRRGDGLGRQHSQVCLQEILYLLWEDSTHPPPEPVDAALAEITHEIRQDPTRRWTVAELAHGAALSRAQFTRRFTAHTGPSPIRYLIQARIDRANRLLSETTMSITQVAATLGYTDIAHFSRQYKQHTGHTRQHARR